MRILGFEGDETAIMRIKTVTNGRMLASVHATQISKITGMISGRFWDCLLM